jgi:hypothetical protein
MSVAAFAGLITWNIWYVKRATARATAGSAQPGSSQPEAARPRSAQPE